MDPDATVILLGNTGVGKSAAGNTILGPQAFPSKASFYSVTKKIQEETGQVFGKLIRVIDTPGILESEEQVKTCCQDLQSFIHVLFLVVVRVDRCSEEDQEAVETAIRIVGDQNFRKTYLLFTCGDALKHESLEEFIHKNSSLQEVVAKFEGRYHLFNNKDGGQEQAEELLQKFLQPAFPVDPVHQVKRRIILIGRIGGGKSSSGNTILGSERFRSGCDFDPVSTETVSESTEVEGRWVTVVDTPGFADEVLSTEQLYMKSLVEASPGPRVFVIVVRIGRVSATDKKLFELLPKLFGSDASKYTMVLFTHGDELRGRSMDDLIQSELVSMCGGRFCVFDNTKRGNRRQVRDFLRRTDEMLKPYITWKLRILKPFLSAVLRAGFVGVKAGVVVGIAVLIWYVKSVILDSSRTGV